jgi:TolA-binding protein
MKLSLINFLLLLTLASCLKTADDIEREKLVERLNVQMQESQQLVADFSIKVKDFEERVSQVNGLIEELEHRQKNMQEENSQSVQAQISQLKNQIEELNKIISDNNKKIVALSSENAETKKFIAEITSTLKAVGQKKNNKDTDNTRDQINKLKIMVDKAQFDKAKPELLALMNQNISNAEKNMVKHALGRIAYQQKNYQEALVYFSKIYTNWPKSSLAPSSLYFIGKSFAFQNNKDAALESFNEFLKQYPKSSLVNDVKNEIQKIK